MSSSRPKTITELAKLAGVAVSTVSKALSGTGKLKAETRQRILDLAAEHDFQLNRTAQNLKRGSTDTIALILPLGHESAQSISDPFFITMIGHIADALTERNKALLLAKVVPVGRGWLSAIVRGGQADGIIVLGQSNEEEELRAVAARYAPMVVWGEYRGADQPYCSVGTDNRSGGRIAAERLLARGCERVVFLGMADIPEIAARYGGFADALLAAGRAAPAPIETHLTPDSAHRTATALLARADRPDGIVCASDVIAISVLRAATEQGLSVPGDLAVVGYDDVPMASFVSPALTTVRQDLADAGARLVELLFQRIAGEATASVSLPPELILRASA